MFANKVKISSNATQKLRALKGRLGITPNILARVGICLSLEEQSIPNPKEYDEEGQEFNRYTLTGQWDSFIIALTKQRCFNDGIPEDDIAEQFRAHLNRGVLTLCRRVKSLVDLENLLQ